MVRQIYIPDEVKNPIKEHLINSILKAVSGFESAYEDEDVLTGHLFGIMKIDKQEVLISNSDFDGIWTWSIDYKKFGGRGKKATESIIGADGIFELHLQNNINNQNYNKSLLFQSKIDWHGRDKGLYIQCSKLLTWLGAATVINYTQENFETYLIDQVISNLGTKPIGGKMLQDLLAGDFIDCKIGDSDLKYDAVQKKLIWLDQSGDIVATKFNLNRRIKINIETPKRRPFDFVRVDKEIPNEDIHKHRLDNEIANYDIDRIESMSDIRNVKTKISKIFHPDKHSKLPDAQKESFSDLMKYYNNKLDIRAKYIKKKHS